MAGKILITIPTKDRWDMVEDVLNRELFYYSKYDIDLCYYDSSENCRTKKIIEKTAIKYGVEIGYKSMGQGLCIDYKLMEMLKDFKNLDYDYFWQINDSISISEDALQYIMSIIDDGYDLIRLPLFGESGIEDYISKDVNDWFQNCSQGMANMGSTIMNKSLLMMDIDWNVLGDKYIFNNTLDERHGYFFMVAFYLEQICRLNKFRGLFIGNRYKWRIESPLKKNQSYWSSKVFECWVKSYPETILKLPDLYSDKENIIRKSDNIIPGRFSKDMLIHYRLQGIYDEKIYNKFKDYFKYVSEVDEEEALRIAIEPIESLLEKYPYLLSIEDQWDSKLEKIEQIIRNKIIYLYGAGFYGDKVIQKLKQDGFSEQIKSVLVTNVRDNVSYVHGIKVYGIDESNIEENSIIIVCTLPGTAEKIKRELQIRNHTNYFSLFEM